MLNRIAICDNDPTSGCVSIGDDVTQRDDCMAVVHVQHLSQEKKMKPT